MKRAARWLVIVPFCITSVSAFAAKTPVGAIPENASVVIRLKAPEQTIKKAVSFANAVQEGAGDGVQQRAAALGTVFENPTMVGMDQTQDWWVVVFAKSDTDPAIVFAVPATDAAGMKNAVGPEYQFVDYDKYTLYSRDADAMGAIKQRAGDAGKSIETLFADKSRQTFETGDISIFLNVTSLKDTYREQLKGLKAQVDEAVQSVTPADGGEAVAGIYSRIVDRLFQAIEDTQAFTVATLISDNGILFDEYSAVKPGSVTDKFLQKQPTSQLNLLSRLPAGELAYLGIHADMASFQGLSMDLIKASLKDKTKQEEVEKLAAEIRAMNFGDTAGCYSIKASGDGLVQGITVSETTDGAKMRDWMRKWSGSMSEIELGGMGQEIKLVQDAETYGDYSADVLTIKQQFDPNSDSSAMQQHIYETMFGPDGMTQSYIYLKDYAVQALNVDRETIMAAIELLSGSKAEAADAAITHARQNLSDPANLIGLLDLPRTVIAALRAATSSGALPIPIDPAMLDSVKIESSYIGFSIATEPQGVRFKWNVPVEQVRGLLGMVMQFQGMLGASAGR